MLWHQSKKNMASYDFHDFPILKTCKKLLWLWYKNCVCVKDVMQGKLFQRCSHLLYCSVLSLGANVNTRRMSKSDMGSIFHIKNQWNILVMGNYYVNYQKYQNLMLLTSSDTKRTLMHLLLFTNSAHRELVSICTQSIHNRNWLSLHYTLGLCHIRSKIFFFGPQKLKSL